MQPTEDYRPKPPAGLPSDRGPVVLVAGSGSVAPDDLYPLLRRRLLMLCSIIAGGGVFTMAVGAALALVVPLDERVEPLTGGRSGWSLGLFYSFVLMLVLLGSAIILWLRPPATIRGLRLIEIICFGSIVAGFLRECVGSVPYGYLQAAMDEPAAVREVYFGRYAAAGSFIWCVVLTSYGAFIPNTWRRCAAMVGVIAMCPLVLFAIYGFWLKPLDPHMVAVTLARLATANVLSSCIAIFASSRIEILRQQAAAARKLGQYVLGEQLGAGGMGEVYRAEHVLLRRPCALKIIRPERAGDPINLRRFEREVQVTATLTHPNTVQIYDYGHATDGKFYYVMEFLPGLTLEELVERDGPLPQARVIHFLRQLCGALAEAHSRGLIHRDIKPGNVMICERGGIPEVAKLLDFGLVLPPPSDSDAEKLTQEGSVAGTPAYISPEQADGQQTLDARSDIYSVGALAYFLLTGRSPFAGRSGPRMLAAHMYEPPQPLRDFRTDVPAELEAVVLRCLAKDPSARFADAKSLDAALAALHTPT